MSERAERADAAADALSRRRCRDAAELMPPRAATPPAADDERAAER